MRHFILLLLVTVLSACTGQQYSGYEADNNANKTGIYVYQLNQGFSKPDFFIDGKHLGEIHAESSRFFALQPGEHTVTVSNADTGIDRYLENRVVNFSLSGGQVRYIKIHFVHRGRMSCTQYHCEAVGNLELAMTNKEQAEGEIKAAKVSAEVSKRQF